MYKTYDPKSVIAALGTHIAVGYGEGTFINIESKGDGVTSKTGCDGETVRSLDPIESYTVTITVLQNSPTVGWCQERYELDKATGDGMFPLLIQDQRGGMIFSAPHAWVVQPPSREFGKEAGEREIKIETGRASIKGESAR